MRLTESEAQIWQSFCHGDYKPDPTAAYTSKDLINDLARMRRAWDVYQGQRDREAIYIYLIRVFLVTRKWLKLRPDGFWAKTALFLQPDGHPEITDPYAIAIHCSADRKIVDRKMRSKWSRVLRYASRKNVRPSKLMAFVHAHGGINSCAQAYARLSRTVDT